MGRVRADERFQTVPAFACSTSMHEAVGSSRSQLSASSTIKFHRFASLDRSRSRSSVPAIRGQTQSGLYTLLRPLLPARLCPCLRSLLLLACTASLHLALSLYALVRTGQDGMPPTGIPASFWRGGTSRGLLFRPGHLAPYPPHVRDRIIFTALGSPDPAGAVLRPAHSSSLSGVRSPCLALSCTRRSADLGVGWRRLVPLESRHRRRAR